MLQMMEALYWGTVVKQAAAGNSEKMEELEAQNRLREEHNLPTIEEELAEIIRKAKEQQKNS